MTSFKSCFSTSLQHLTRLLNFFLCYLPSHQFSRFYFSGRYIYIYINSKVFLGTFYFAQFSLLAVFLDVKVSMHLYVGNSQVCKYSFLNFLLLSPFPTLLFQPASDPRPPNVLSSTLAPRRSSPFLLRYSYYGGHCLDSRVP